VPEMGAGHCLGPEGNGVSLAKGGKGGPSSPGSKEDKQSVLSEGGGNMEGRRRKDKSGDEEGPARTV
jgi:hypothetical protein